MSVAACASTTPLSGAIPVGRDPNPHRIPALEDVGIPVGTPERKTMRRISGVSGEGTLCVSLLARTLCVSLLAWPRTQALN